MPPTTAGRGAAQPPYHPADDGEAPAVRLLYRDGLVAQDRTGDVPRRGPFGCWPATSIPTTTAIAEFRKRHLEALAGGVRAGAAAVPGGGGWSRWATWALDGTKAQGQRLQAQGDELRPPWEGDRAPGWRPKVHALLETGPSRSMPPRMRSTGRAAAGVTSCPDELARAGKSLGEDPGREGRAPCGGASPARPKRPPAGPREAGGPGAPGGRGEGPAGAGARPRRRPQPAPTAQRNFTDPESRIMVDGATKGVHAGLQCASGGR